MSTLVPLRPCDQEWSHRDNRRELAGRHSLGAFRARRTRKCRDAELIAPWENAANQPKIFSAVLAKIVG